MGLISRVSSRTYRYIPDMPLSLKECCALARHALDERNQENAEKFVELALQIEGGTEDPDALEVTGLLMHALGDLTSASDCMERAVDADKIKLAEEITSTTVLQNKPDMIRRMLSLAEYYKGSMAYELFKTALDISTELANDHKRSSMIAASIAELYLSEPLCMKPDAKEKCKEFVGVCLSSDEKNVDGWSLKASYHISSEELEEAKESLKRGLGLYDEVEKNIEESEKIKDSGDSQNNDNTAEITTDFSLTDSQKTRLIQLCTELSFYEKAVEIGEKILLTDKTQYHVLYYMGWAASLSENSELKDASRDYLNNAHQLLLQLKKTPDFGRADFELLGHVKELIEKTGGKLEEIDVSLIPDEEVEQWVERCIEGENDEMED